MSVKVPADNATTNILESRSTQQLQTLVYG